MSNSNSADVDEDLVFHLQTPIRKIGIMTCGGDCPGLNPVIRAATISAIRQGWRVIGIEDSMQGLINLNYRSPHGNVELTLEKVEDIITRGGTILGSDNHSDPFRYAVFNEKGEKEERDISRQVILNIKKLQLDALVVIGGDGSISIANKLRALTGNTLRVVGVPKTIDNDLAATDYTFGFNTAIQTITEAIDKIKDTACSHDRTIIIEVMGRDAGWLALHGGIAGAAHVILVPEIPYDVAAIGDTIRNRDLNGRPFTIIVIAEGAKASNSSASYLKERQAGEMIRYGGAGDRLCAELEKYAKHEKIPLKEIRVTVLGYIQRGGSPTNFDRILGTRLGEHAVSEILAKGLGGHMAALRGTRIETVTFEEATAFQKLIDPQTDQLIKTAKTLGICVGNQDHLPYFKQTPCSTPRYAFS
eukprot:TRINITY_DN1117_c0_g1_i2.p1 TRINITY_DN1117_c0_g1~~TRINITY_DN1117_c0_g1_i2.p1  ORF type:complete len:466 (+),score=79.29 TRINITY_DN1117_c0_g1_i2:150-1400(+)